MIEQAPNSTAPGIETRHNPAELQQLNDESRLRIFGPDGLLQKVRGTPGIYGSIDYSEEERENFVKYVEHDIHRLVRKEGLELCQAELVMRLWLRTRTVANQVRADCINKGASEEEAEMRVWGTKEEPGIYARINQSHLDKIKNGNAFTQEEYSAKYPDSPLLTKTHFFATISSQMPETLIPPKNTQLPQVSQSKSLAELHPGLVVYQHMGGDLEDVIVHNQRRPESEISGEPVIYSTPDQAGNFYATVIIDRPGGHLAWRDHKHTRKLNRQVMLTTESGRQYYVHGDSIIDVAASLDKGGPVSKEIAPDQPLSDIEVGQGWMGITDPINKIEVVEDKVPADKFAGKLEDYEQIRGRGEIAEVAEWFASNKAEGNERLGKTASAVKKAGRLAAAKTAAVAYAGLEYGVKADAKAIEYAANLDKKAFEYGLQAGKKGVEYGRWARNRAAEEAGNLATVNWVVLEEIKAQSNSRGYNYPRRGYREFIRNHKIELIGALAAIAAGYLASEAAGKDVKNEQPAHQSETEIAPPIKK